jgi:hypothetical protein
MALKAGRKGPRSEAQGCARTTASRRRTLRGRPADGLGATSVFPCAMNSRFRTGADKGNPTV